jgi:hypothetical protein
VVGGRQGPLLFQKSSAYLLIMEGSGKAIARFAFIVSLNKKTITGFNK